MGLPPFSTLFVEIISGPIQKKIYLSGSFILLERLRMKPWILSLILLAGSLAVSAALFLMGLPFFFFFLIIPLIPFLNRKRTVRRCPVCGWETTGSERFCPCDATPLTGSGSETRDGQQ
jgi:hypothetical protein